MARRLTLLLILLVSSGCDPIWRVSQSQVLQVVPPPTCLLHAVEAYPGLSEVAHQAVAGAGSAVSFNSKLGRGLVYVAMSESGDPELRAEFSEIGFSSPPEVASSAPSMLDSLLLHIDSRCGPAV